MAIRCVAGLGNPGARYEWTRHNAGFWVVDRIAREAGARWSRRSNGEEAEAVGEWGSVLLLKPRTYMNASGEAVLDCLARWSLSPSQLLLVVDDVALPAGKIRLRQQGGAGGHRGMISVEQSIGSDDYPRLRVGVGGGEDEEDLAEYVLRPLDEREREFFERVVSRAVDAVRSTLVEGLDTAMNRFNTEPATE